MAGLETLFDTLAGAAGAPVNRAGLNNYVATSQALNGLRSAQTDDAMLKAQLARDQMSQDANLESDLAGALGVGHEADAKALATAIRGGHGNMEQGGKFLLDSQQFKNRGVLGDVSKLGTPDQTAAQQGVKGEVAPLVNVPDNYAALPGQTLPTVQQTPLGAAQTAEHNANAHLHNAQADAGGFNPHVGQGALAALPPDQQTALNTAMEEGRLDPAKINSRNARILGPMAVSTPGFNFNKMSADAALQRNAGFQQKTMTFETLPTVLAHMKTLGQKLGYSDNRTVGKMQQFMNGEFNDPDYTEYMGVRNDSLLSLAGLMRSVGMSDQAHRAEIEAASPTLSPLALEGWYKGQMSVLSPRLERSQRVLHLGEGHTPPANGAAPAGGAADDPLGIRG